MAKFNVMFWGTGGVEIEAQDRYEAQEIFNAMDDHELAEEIRLNGIETPEIVEVNE